MIRLKIKLLCKCFILLFLFLSLIHAYINNNNYKLYKNNGNDIGKIINIINGEVNNKIIIQSDKYNYYSYIDKSLSKDLKFGDVISFSYTNKEVNSYKIFNTFDFNIYLKSLNITNIITINKYKKLSYSKSYIFKNKLLNLIDDRKSSSYIKAFLFCDKSYIDDDIANSFYSNGIIHLLCVSGFHIVFLLSILKRILRFIFSSNTLINIFLFLISYLYLFNTGLNISFLRAFLFYFLCTLNNDLNINIDNKYILLLVLSINFIFKPLSIYASSFWYTYILSFVLIVYSNKINRYKLVRISLLCFIASMPLTIFYNYSINLFSILFSIIFSFFVCYLIYPLCFLSVLFSVFDNILYFFINIFEKANLFISNNISLNIIFSKMNVYYLIILYLVLLLFIFNRKYKYVFFYLLLVFILYFKPYLFSSNKVYFIDVHQGDMSLIQLGRKTVLIDTGGDIYNNKYLVSNTIKFFYSLGIKYIDYLIISHGDYDHMGASLDLVNKFKIKNVVFNCGELNNLEKELIVVLGKKKIPYYACIKELNIDDNKLYFLQTKVYDNENNNSNVIYTELNGYKFMFMGDAGVEKEKDILDKYNISHIDVLKVGHHGSKTSSNETFVKEINPKYSIISVGKNNRYGHPNKEVLKLLEKSKVYRTDQDGSIMFKIKYNRINLEKYVP